MIKVSLCDRKSVYDMIKQRYEDRGNRNYYFRSYKLAEEFEMSPYVVGRTAMWYSINGTDIQCVKANCKNGNLFRTNFK